MSTMLLFTTMPASAITPTPPITMPKGRPVTSRPSRTPAIEKTMALSTTTDW